MCAVKHDQGVKTMVIYVLFVTVSPVYFPLDPTLTPRHCWFPPVNKVPGLIRKAKVVLCLGQRQRERERDRGTVVIGLTLGQRQRHVKACFVD